MADDGIGAMLEDFDDVDFIEEDDDTTPDDTGEDNSGNADDVNDDDTAADDGTDATDDKIAKLEAELETQKRILEAVASKKSTDDTNADAAPAGFELTEVEYSPTEFVSEDFDIDTLTPETLNTMLNTAAKNAAQLGAKHAAKQVLLAIPGIVKHNVSVQSTIQESVKQFYSENKDLLGFKKAVGIVAEELASKNPDWNISKLFSEAGKETRTRLNITKPKKSGRKTGVAGGEIGVRGQRGRTKGQVIKGLEKEIGDMLNTK